MAELLHYLDKMEYRPVPKPKPKIVLKRELDSGEAVPLEIVDKRAITGFKRQIVKEYERIIGVVQEKKRREGEPATQMPNRQIYVEHFLSRETEEDLTVPVPLKQTEQEVPELPSVKEEGEVTPAELTKQQRSLEEAEEEPKTPEDKSLELHERMKELEDVEPKTPEDKSRELEEMQKRMGEERDQDQDQDTEGAEEGAEEGVEEPEAEPEEKAPKQKAPKRKEIVPAEKIPKVRITETTEINGEPVLDRIPKVKELNKLVVRAPTYYMENRKLYTTRIASLFKEFSKELLDENTAVSCDRQGSTKNIDLLIHQRIVREYLNLYTPYRGLLLYHGLGSGKTCTSIAIAEAAKTDKRIFVLTPASLKMNFFSELKKCGDSLYKKNQFWEFISVDGRPEYVSILSQVLAISTETVMKNGGAWLVDIKQTEPNYANLSPENQKVLDEQLNEMIRSKYVDINYNGLTERNFKAFEDKYADPITGNPFDHSVVLVDEAHNLVSRIVNNLKKPTSISVRLYNYLQSAQDVRIVFMSGTPIINYPNEMGVLFNMLRGHIKTWKFTVPSAGAKKLTAETIVDMFRKADFRTYDYVDYSNDTLTITRNPFGFINTKKPGVPAGQKRVSAATKVPMEKTLIRGGDVKPLDREDSDSDSDTDSDSSSDEEDKSDQTRGRCRVSAKKHHSSKKRASRKNLRQTLLPHYEQDEIVQGKPYTKYREALVLRKPIETGLSDEVKEQIAYEVERDANNMGEDKYHYGGAIVVDDRYYGVHLDEQGNISDVDFVNRVKEILSDNNVTYLPEIKLIKNQCLPEKQDEFATNFINMNTLTVQRPDVLKKRILGLTSYFRSAQESLLPQFILSTNQINPQFHVEYVEMSDHQFVDYAKERTLEMKREPKKKSGANANKELLKTSGSYRTFTRAKCNFTFPAEIPRPMPPGFDPEKDVRSEEFDNIRDDNEQDIGAELDAVAPISVEYERSIATALETLKAQQATYLTPTALQSYSPKFAKILANLQDQENKGLHLVYSAFRTLEGIGVLKLVLEANGFAEFKLKKTADSWSIVETDPDESKPRFVLYTGTESAEEKEVIRNIYNSNWEFVPANLVEKLKAKHENNFYGEIIKIIMITSSGAEGINLENTRFVHIVEPYWHMVRIDQVVGRARRICSHKNLPEELRTIKVFLYMSKFSEKQKTSGENVGIMNRDTSRLQKAPPGAKLGATAITTDESLFEIAVIKDRLTKQLLKSVKESSVDCNVYNNSKEGLACYTYGYSTSNEFGSFPTYEEDSFVREKTDVQEKVVKPVMLEIEGVKFAHVKETGELFNYKEYKENGRQVLMGHLGYKDGKKVLQK